LRVVAGGRSAALIIVPTPAVARGGASAGPREARSAFGKKRLTASVMGVFGTLSAPPRASRAAGML
jgi:hypothetical protein